ncbi:MAG TPA: L-glutamate gamma-semialdehyde dehydrogenase [Bacillota bacterium]|nr:L-glutamate gamma-semialdehyde dehydrogenase [Bacillota bacterium]HPF42352.1 L-glutamate gamma-semialdehyde dehydrogenase [Bacillota bacterium]HPJ86139.1 L-glutamate gamma-semialdehyde dehydrogenase [Bacillota bacterium]HPQ61391.1 L-glutamate gamma-semialdehyde dehydrogenase [Bacillota bacterium]
MAIYEYRTEPLTDFSKEENRKKYEEALKKVGSELGGNYPLVIGGRQIYTKNVYTSVNPANHSQKIGTICQAGIKEADEAMEAALKAFETWKKTDAKVRAGILFKLAAIMKRERFEFNAIMTLEAGKPWIEADADTAEAIDFLEYYGRQMLSLERIDDAVLSRRDIEKNEYRYIPLGVGAIITPWNFPMAILTGMTSAAIVTGNTVLLKPAMTTQVIAYKFVDALKRAGLPDGVVNYMPGRGSEIGDYIVKHPKTRFISFTGSKDVGQTIYENAAKVNKGQIWLKRVIAEMGGKDAILVDSDCDTEMAAQAIVASAFGFSGQKCSACSRAIIHQDVYDEIVTKIVEKTKKLKVGDPSDFQMNMGPVNDDKAYKMITDYIEIGKKEGKLVAGGKYSDEHGWFIDPTVIVDLDPHARIMQEEIFGPVLAVTKVSSFEEGIMVANDTEFGLTGAAISNNRAHLEMAKADFHVGNLYLNRKCTGAIVGYQPFGGFNMSGTDSKAGGPDYLVLHMQGKSIAEAL